ncbi:MAG: PAS domain-containing protein, partial [Gemmatimonadetes bacterium]|nr:PAS domain-containing protein [Gemmatimonadota bacterium]
MAEPKLRFPVRKLAALRPGYLALLFVVLALVLGAFALYGLRQAQQSTLETLERGARSLAEAVSRAEENVLRAEGDMEELVGERLLDNARLLAELGLTQSLSDTFLVRIAADNALDQVDVFDVAGQLVASSGVVDAEELVEWQRELEPLLVGTEEVLLFELDDQLFAVAVAMRDGGAVIVRAAAERLLHLRIRSGAGRLIQEIGTNQDIVYMALQDTLGLLAASHDLVLLESISGDAFLETALTSNAVASRLVEFEGEEIFEVVIPFAPQGTTLGLLRIGLSLDELRAQEQRGRLQVALLVLLLLVLGAVGTGAVIVRQNLALLSDAYANIQTYSSRILAQMTEAVVATDPAGAIEVFNQAAEALFGVEGEQVRGQHLRDVWPHEAVDRALAGEELVGLSCRFTDVQGRERTLSLSSAQVYNASGEVETIVLVIQDLSEKVALEADLRRRDRLASMGALASGVAHEVRNPLNAISVIVQRLRREFTPRTDDDEYRQLTQVVAGEVERVN